jgi:hypothetical protein
LAAVTRINPHTAGIDVGSLNHCCVTARKFDRCSTEFEAEILQIDLLVIDPDSNRAARK